MSNRTAEGAAMMRAMHQRLPADERILDDPLAERLVDMEGEGARLLESFVGDKGDEAAKLLLGFVIRSRFTEDCLRRAHARGTRQYALVGAGLDTFPYRQPSWACQLSIVEIDRAEALEFKRRRLSMADIDVPPNVRFVAGTLGERDLPSLLRAGGFRLDRPIFASFLGVSQYIPRDLFDEVMSSFASLAGGSEIVFSVLLPEELLPDGEQEMWRQIASSAAKGGEPMISRLEPQSLKPDLLAMGFRDVEHFSPERRRPLTSVVGGMVCGRTSVSSSYEPRSDVTGAIPTADVFHSTCSRPS